MNFKGWMIKDANGSYSLGMVRKGWSSSNNKYYVQWKNSTKTAKVWLTEAAVKEHLLKCKLNGVPMNGWEIIEIYEKPSTAIDEWFDSKMLMKILKDK